MPDDLVAQVATVLLVTGFVVMLPGGLYRFMLPKLLVLAVAVLMAALSPPAGRLPRSVAWTSVACGAVLVVATLASAAPLAQAVGRWPRYEGLVALPLYAGAVWAGARLLGPRCPPGRRHLALTAAAWASVVLAVVSVAEVAGLRPLGGDVARPGALLGNASDQGTVAAILIGLLGATAARAHPMLGVGAVAAGVSVVASGSRAGLGAALVAVAVAGVGRTIAARPERRAWTVAAVSGAAVVLVAGAFALPTTSQRLTGADDLAAASAEGRGLVWETATATWTAHPWTGVGPSGFVDAATRHLPASWWDTQDPTMALDSPHSAVLQVAVAGGVPLLAATLVFGAAVVWQARRRWQTTTHDERPGWWGASAALAAAVVALSVGFTSPATVPLAAVLLGWLVAAPSPGRSRTSDRPVNAGRWTWPGSASRLREVAAASPRQRVGTRGAEALHPTRLGWAVTAGALVLVLVPAVAAEVPLAQAQSAAVRGEVAQTEQALEAARRLRPWDADVDLLGACMLAPLALGGDRAAATGAVDHARRALTRLPDSAEAQRCQVIGSLSLGDLAGARTQLDRALVLAPDNPELLLLSGYTFAASGRLTEAVTPLEAATTNPFTAQRAWSLLAKVYAELGEPEAAARAGRRATDPSNR